jgi:tetratricopeptide (TPR) repeat protein
LQLFVAGGDRHVECAADKAIQYLDFARYRRCRIVVGGASRDRSGCSRTGQIAAFLRWLFANVPRLFLVVASFVYQNFSGFLAKGLWATAGVVIAAIVIRGLTERVTVIEPISVPKTLAERGYTPDVAAQRLQDAMRKFAGSANTHMRQPEIALHAELPNIVVPTVGISLDAIMSTIRTLFRSTRSQSIGGEFTVIQDKLWLRLRLNGLEFYNSKDGGNPDKPDELLTTAVPEAMKKTQPYFVAASRSNNNDPDGALEMVTWIIATLPESDENVAWAYNLKGSLLTESKDYPAAKEALKKALALDSRLAVVHVNLGNVLKDEGNVNEALREYREAINLDPTYPMSYYNMGVLLRALKDNEGAIAAYREAIRLDPKYASALNNMGLVLKDIGKLDDAIAAYREATRINPTDVSAHNNLGIALRTAGKLDDASIEYRKAIAINDKYVFAHNNLGYVLDLQGKTDEAISEYKRAIEIDPKYVRARINLGVLLNTLGKADEAIVQFRAILDIDQNNETARNYLDVLQGTKG